MTLYLVTLGWAIVGVLTGIGIRRASVWLARKEELEPGFKPWQVYGPAILSTALFALFAWHLGGQAALLIRTLWVVVLVQVIFFDFEHRLILDRWILPAMVAAAGLAFLTPGLIWWQALAAGVAAGLAFLVLALAGSLMFGAGALGFGDVKLALFIGLVMGPGVLAALIYGVFLAGAISILLILVRVKTMKDTIAYGPYLAAGALIELYRL